MMQMPYISFQKLSKEITKLFIRFGFDGSIKCNNSQKTAEICGKTVQRNKGHSKKNVMLIC